MTDTCSAAEESFTTAATTDAVENNTSMRGKGVDHMLVKAMAVCHPVHMRDLKLIYGRKGPIPKWR